MSTPSRRVVAVAVAAIIAVLTAAAVGLVGPQRTCAPAGGATVTCSIDVFAPVPAVIALLGAVAAAGFALALLGGGAHPDGDRDRPAGQQPTGRRDRPTPGGPVDTAPDRAVLVEACIYVRDRLTSRALADRLGSALDAAGVRTDAPTGDRFDPARHEAGSAAPSTDPARIGTIAAVEVPGYTDRDGRALRVPVVTVYRAAAATDPGDPA